METKSFPRPLALRPREAAAALGISQRTLWGLTQPRGPIPCVHLGNGARQAVLYPLDQLNAWLRAHSAANEPGHEGDQQ